MDNTMIFHCNATTLTDAFPKSHPDAKFPWVIYVSYDFIASVLLLTFVEFTDTGAFFSIPGHIWYGPAFPVLVFLFYFSD